MRIKKYKGPNEKDAMMKVKDELGPEALIISVKNIKPGGLNRLFKKPYVEVTAALDDKMNAINHDNKEQIAINENLNDESFIQLLREYSQKSEVDTQNQALEQSTNGYAKENIVEANGDVLKEIETEAEREYSEDSPLIKVLYEQLLENEIDERFINEIMVGFPEIVFENDVDIDELISILYKRIAKIISDFETIKLKENEANVVVFVGPTGVGKTTTIAKIASHFTLNLNKKVALLTADTYRVAAVEQLRTYADILNIPIKAIYSPSELQAEIKSFSDYDLILVDTAGRSPRNSEHHQELIELLDVIDEKDIYLVLSLSTKYKDLIKIVKQYEDVNDFKIIFTKLDETSSYGNILNIKMHSNTRLSYVTFGQNVPDDISEINVHDITKKLLGGCE